MDNNLYVLDRHVRRAGNEPSSVPASQAQFNLFILRARRLGSAWARLGSRDSSSRLARSHTKSHLEYKLYIFILYKIKMYKIKICKNIGQHILNYFLALVP
jgi:hypothetical protein